MMSKVSSGFVASKPRLTYLVTHILSALFCALWEEGIWSAWSRMCKGPEASTWLADLRGSHCGWSRVSRVEKLGGRLL
jgi:hypothetical protein